MKIRGLKAALNSTDRYSYKAPEATIDHLIIGGGVVGLAIARRLSLHYPEKSTFVVERNKRAGEETSSRNSEVIHAGLYYPPNSLKAQLCILGRELLYQYCIKHNVPFQKCGKLVVAMKHQLGYINSLHKKASNMRWPSSFSSSSNENAAVPTTLLTGDAARELEPDLSDDIVSALYSPETGIIDSHAFMSSLEQEITSSDGGDIVYSTRVVRVDPYDDREESGWVVQMTTANSNSNSNSKTSDTFLARTIINASGLSSNLVLNALLPRENRIPMYFARGSYAAYNGPGISRNSRLIYPCPDADKTGHAFQSLGTHLTRDIEGNVKFGPDIQWISPSGSKTSPESSPTPSSISLKDNDNDLQEEFSFDEEDVDFWKQHLTPDSSQLEAMIKAVKTYLPNVEASKFRPDYVGVRPKLVPPWGGFQDFVFRVDYPYAFLKSNNSGRNIRKPMISLLGIESPGLTASLAIAEKVHAMLDNPI